MQKLQQNHNRQNKSKLWETFRTMKTKILKKFFHKILDKKNPDKFLMSESGSISESNFLRRFPLENSLY